MVSGEFTSMTVLHSVILDSAPAPIVWETYPSNQDIHFFLCHFIDMIDEVSDTEAFTDKVTELRTRSMSPNGKYGSELPTYTGQMAQYNNWTDPWEEFFIIVMEQLTRRIEESQGLRSRNGGAI